MPTPSTSRTQKVATFFIGLTLVVSAGFSVPSRAHAFLGFGDIVFDPGAFVQMIVDWGVQYAMNLITDSLTQKEIIWDTIANAASKAVLQTMAQSVTNWASSGFDGSPTFVTNYQEHLLTLEDTTVNSFIEGYLSDGRVQSPFSNRVAESARQAYYQNTGTGTLGAAHPYTLNQTCANDAAFLSGDFSQCGLSGWIAAWRDPANNPFGSEFLTTDAALQSANTAADTRTREIGWGNGFLPVRNNCNTTASADSATGAEGEGSTDTSSETSTDTSTDTATDGETVNLTASDNSSNCSISTPSSVVAHALNKVSVDLGIDIGVSSDEISEVIAQFFVQMIGDTLFNDNGGLAGAGTGARGASGGVASTTPTTNAINSLSLTMSNAELTVQQFKERWESIKEISEEAKTKLFSCGASEAGIATTGAQAKYNNEVKPVLLQAESSLKKADDALVKIDAFKVRIANLQSGEEDFLKLAQEIQEFQGSGIPSPQEIIYAAQQSIDVPEQMTQTVYSKMKKISTATCASFNTVSG